jgi:hypothetical protein
VTSPRKVVDRCIARSAHAGLSRDPTPQATALEAVDRDLKVAASPSRRASDRCSESRRATPRSDRDGCRDTRPSGSHAWVRAATRALSDSGPHESDRGRDRILARQGMAFVTSPPRSQAEQSRCRRAGRAGNPGAPSAAAAPDRRPAGMCCLRDRCRSSSLGLRASQQVAQEVGWLVRPARWAMAAASPRFAACSLRRMLETWTLAVLRLM